MLDNRTLGAMPALPLCQCKSYPLKWKRLVSFEGGLWYQMDPIGSHGSSYNILWLSLLAFLTACYCTLDHSLTSYCFPGGSAGEESTYNAGDLGSIPGLGRSPRERKDYPLQYSSLGNSMVRIVHRVANSQTQRSGFHFNFHMYSHIFFNLHLQIFLLRRTFTLCCLIKCNEFWHLWFCHIGSINSHPQKIISKGENWVLRCCTIFLPSRNRFLNFFACLLFCVRGALTEF